MPEILGAVEDITRTKGFAVAEIGSLNQLASRTSTAGNAIHEVYHLLGCNHEDDSKSCIDSVLLLKKAARKNREKGIDFFPALPVDKTILSSRHDVDRKLSSFAKGLCTLSASI